MTLFDKYGGVPTVTLIVRAFLKMLLTNYKLKPYFEGIDAERLINHQIGFISHLLGKPADIHVEKVLSHSHKGRRISEDAFDEVLHILHEVLVETQKWKKTISKQWLILCCHIKRILLKLKTLFVFTRHDFYRKPSIRVTSI
jgi:truncated hemoglobin YjbI